LFRKWDTKGLKYINPFVGTCMTHAELVVRAIRWLRNQKGCSFVLSEQFAAGVAEQPDAIGWKYGDQSHLIECKISRSDFFADAAKPFRRNGAKGIR
jgi:hypothetical protein